MSALLISEDAGADEAFNEAPLAPQPRRREGLLGSVAGFFDAAGDAFDPRDPDTGRIDPFEGIGEDLQRSYASGRRGLLTLGREAFGRFDEDWRARHPGEAGEIERARARGEDIRDAAWFDDWLKREGDAERRVEARHRVDPASRSEAANIIGGFAGLFASAALTGPIGTGGGYGLEEYDRLIGEGVDPATAEAAAKVAGFGMGLAVMAPAALPSRAATLPARLGQRAVTGAGVNVGVGMGTRASVEQTLRERGYDEQAEAYKWLDARAIAIDLLFGAAFGAAAGERLPSSPRIRAEDAPETAPPEAPGGPGEPSPQASAPYRPSPDMLAAALVEADAIHAETAFGIPLDGRSARFGADALDEGMRQAAADEPLVPPEAPAGVDFIPMPRSPEEAQAEIDAIVSLAREAHMAEADVQALEAAARERGLYPEATEREALFSRAPRNDELSTATGREDWAAENVAVAGRYRGPNGFVRYEFDGPQGSKYQLTMEPVEYSQADFKHIEWPYEKGDTSVTLESRTPRTSQYGRQDRFNAGEVRRIFFAALAAIEADARTAPRKRYFIAGRKPNYSRIFAAMARRLQRASNDPFPGFDIDIDAQNRVRITRRDDAPMFSRGDDWEAGAPLDKRDFTRTPGLRREAPPEGAPEPGTPQWDAALEAARAKPASERTPLERALLRWDAEDGLLSRARELEERAGPATSAEALRDAAIDYFGDDAETLFDMAKVEIVGDGAEAAARSGWGRISSDVKAFHWKGKTYILARNVSPREMASIMLHEVGVHAGMKEMLGERGFARLTAKVDALAAAGNPIAALAKERVKELVDAGLMNPAHAKEEALAYLVQEAKDLPFVRRLLAQLRQWLWRTFNGAEWLGELTAEDIRQMAVASLRRQARLAKREAAEAQMLGDFDPAQAVTLASREGYQGADTGEAIEWLRAKAKGLPMDEASRLSRANAAGFTVDAFRGLMRAPETRDGVQWFSENPEVASTYAAGEGANVLPARIRPGRVVEVTAPGAIFRNIPVEAVPRNVRKYFPRSTTHVSTNEIASAAQFAGYDAVKFNGIRDSAYANTGFETGDLGAVWAVAAPRNIRSRFAAFDPDYADSANLLASRSPGDETPLTRYDDPVGSPDFQERLKDVQARFGSGDDVRGKEQGAAGGGRAGVRGAADQSGDRGRGRDQADAGAGPGRRVVDRGSRTGDRGRDQALAREEVEDILAVSGIRLQKHVGGYGDHILTTDTPFALEGAAADLDSSALKNVIRFHLHERTKRLIVRVSETATGLRGKGVGGWMYRQLLDWAFEHGYQVYSDFTVSGMARRVYESLRNDGYILMRNPRAVEQEDGGWKVDEDRSVYQVRLGPDAVTTRPAAPPPPGGYVIDGPSLSERLAKEDSRRQAFARDPDPVKQALADEPDLEIPPEQPLFSFGLRGESDARGNEAFYDPRLNAGQNKAVEMARNGYTNAEIAEEMDTGANVVKVLLSQARAAGVDVPRGRRGLPGVNTITMEPTVSTERLLELRDQLRKAGFREGRKGSRVVPSIFDAIAQRTGLSREAVYLRFWSHDRAQKKAQPASEALAEAEAAEAEAREMKPGFDAAASCAAQHGPGES